MKRRAQDAPPVVDRPYDASALGAGYLGPVDVEPEPLAADSIAPDEILEGIAATSAAKAKARRDAQARYRTKSREEDRRLRAEENAEDAEIVPELRPLIRRLERKVSVKKRARERLVQILLEPAEKRKLARIARLEGRSLSNLCRRLLTQLLSLGQRRVREIAKPYGEAPR